MTSPYGHKWRKARAAYLAANPLCVECYRVGRLTPSTEVDHIIAHKGNNDLFWSRSNWRAICKVCHNAKTGRIDGGFGNARKIASYGHGIDGMPVDAGHHWRQ